MVALAPERAPTASLPLRYLRMVPVWGVIAGIVILFQGADIFTSRWAPATIALVHVFTLGVLGNAVLGSLLQFLPAVADVRPLALERLGLILPVLFNVGTAGLVGGLMLWPGLLPWSAPVVAASLGVFATSALLGFRHGSGSGVLRLGLFVALCALLLTAVLGWLLAWGRAGLIVLPMAPLIDSHATTAVFGALLLLSGIVGSVVLPMFQGTAAVPTCWLAGWMALLVGAIATAIGLRTIGRIGGEAMVWLLAAPCVCFSVAMLYLQRRAVHRRNPNLTAFWRWAAVTLLAAALVAVENTRSPGPGRDVLVGALVLGVALPALVIGMWLEITVFLAWLELQRRRPRGHRVPGVTVLLPDAAKSRLLRLHLLAGVMLLGAAAWPNADTVILAAATLAIAYGAAGSELYRLGLRCRRLIAAMPPAREPPIGE